MASEATGGLSAPRGCAAPPEDIWGKRKGEAR
jgi:hypothetical protein